MSKEARNLNLMNAEHVALLAYMQRYIQSITKEGKRPGDVMQIRGSLPADASKQSRND